MKNIFDLSEKKIVVTGGASGIGRETCIRLSKLNARVIILDISTDGMHETQKLSVNNTFVYFADFSDIDSLSDLVNNIVQDHGPIDGLVHCAGISSRKPLNMLKTSGFEKLMKINFFSFVELVRLFTRKNSMRDNSSIVAMSSISSIMGYKAKTEYCVSKAALDAFIRCVALELAPKGIRVNSIMPAEVLTPMAIRARELNESLGASEFKAPLGPSFPYEIANTIIFLLSDATKTITGTTILIDGGATI